MFTYQGLTDILAEYFSADTFHEILMDESGGLSEQSPIEDFVAAEPRTDFGYTRKVLPDFTYSNDTANKAVVSSVSQQTHTAAQNDPFSFDAIGILRYARATANVLVASISGNTITTQGAHGCSVGDPVILTDASTFPASVTEKTLYYVASAPSATTLTIAATEGGPAFAPGNSFTGDLVLRNAKGVLVQWSRRAGSGDVSFTIQAGAAHTTKFRVGMKSAGN